MLFEITVDFKQCNIYVHYIRVNSVIGVKCVSKIRNIYKNEK